MELNRDLTALWRFLLGRSGRDLPSPFQDADAVSRSQEGFEFKTPCSQFSWRAYWDSNPEPNPRYGLALSN